MSHQLPRKLIKPHLPVSTIKTALHECHGNKTQAVGPVDLPRIIQKVDNNMTNADIAWLYLSS